MMAGQGEWGRGRVQAIHHHHTVEILRGTVLYIFCFKINTLLCYTVVSVLGIGIARGQYYWILGALFGIVLTLVAITMLYQQINMGGWIQL